MPRRHAIRDASTLAGWVALSLCAGLIGSRFLPGPWYADLSKPAWTPPNVVFGPVWTVLYVTMGISAWMVWQRRAERRVSGALVLFGLQLCLNALWSYLCFGRHLLGVASVEIVVLFVAVVLCAAAFGRVRPAAGLLLVPYALWVAFAGMLNIALWRMNG